MFTDTLTTLSVVAFLVVVVILVFGLGKFAKGGADGAKQSNKLMQYRLIAQAVAVLIFIIIVAFKGGFGGGS